VLRTKREAARFGPRDNAQRARPAAAAISLSENKMDKPRAHSLQSRNTMRNNWFAALLVAMLFLSAAVAVRFAIMYAFSTRALRSPQPQMMMYQARLNLAQALLNDTLEYSKHNPAIDPLLHSLHIKTNSAPASAAAAGK
jgi:hypothetical protein